MIKDHQYFYQRKIFIKMAKPLLIILNMADSNQPQLYKLQFILLVVGDHIKMSMTEPHDEYYLLPVREL